MEQIISPINNLKTNITQAVSENVQKTTKVFGYKHFSRIATHVGLVLTAFLVIAVSGFGPTTTGTVSSLIQPDGYGGLVDKTASVYIASEVANQLDLVVASEINQQVKDVANQAELAVSAEHYLAKPNVVATGAASSRDIITYTVKAGETIPELARRFNITSNTIRWANNLDAASNLRGGQRLVILPVTGILHTVTSGDTLETLAATYQASKQRIASFNDTELTGIRVGQKLVIPDGVRPNSPQPQVPSTSFAIGTLVPTYGNNLYDYGWCTWHVANRRAQIGKPIPNNWGNAISWRYSAVASGYRVGSTPRVGAVAYNNYVGGLGHVSFVEAVHGDRVTVSDMNFPTWGVATRRTVPVDYFTYIY